MPSEGAYYRVKESFAPREVAHGALPGAVLSDQASSSHASYLREYERQRTDTTNNEIRNVRRFEAAIPTAGVAPPPDSRFFSRVEGESHRSPRHQRLVDTNPFRAVNEPLPASPRVNLPSYNTVNDTNAVEKSGLTSVPATNTTKRQKFEYSHHVATSPHKIARPTYGLHNDGGAEYNILSGLKEGEKKVETTVPKSNEFRRHATVTSYSYDIVSGQSIVDKPHSNLDPRVRSNAMPAVDQVSERRQLKAAPPVEANYNPVSLQLKKGHEGEQPTAEKGIFRDNERVTPRVRASVRDFDIVNNRGAADNSSSRRLLKAGPPEILQAQREQDINYYVFDSNGHPMKHMRRRPAETHDHVTDVLNARPPPPERAHKRTSGAEETKGDSMWGVFDNSSPRKSLTEQKDNTAPRLTMHVVGDHHSSPRKTDHVWFEAHKQSNDVKDREHRRFNRPTDVWSPATGGSEPLREVRQRPGPRDSIHETISNTHL